MLSPAIAVALRQASLTLCSYDEREPIELRLAELLVLEQLAREPHVPANEIAAAVASRVGAEPEGLRGFIDELRARALVVSSSPDVRPVAAGRVRDDVASPPVAGTSEFIALTPLLFRVTESGFTALDHDGGVIALVDAVQLAAACEFRVATSVTDALERHRAAAGALALDDAPFEALVTRLLAVGLLAPFDPHDVGGRENRDAREMYAFFVRASKAVDAACAAHVAAEATRDPSEPKRVPIVPIDDHGNPMPLALGMIIAYAMAYKDRLLETHYRVVPRWLTRHDREVASADEPSIFLFSNYIWSHGQNLAFSEKIKQLSPHSITVHGGPDTPKYDGDVEAYFAENPHVDVAVHGEGEETTAELLEALIGVVGDGPPDLSALQEVPGLTYRHGDRAIRTGKRERLTELDTIPSPFLTGVFDIHASAGASMAILETNRGCPYGCTFCDWGSATLSRIRKFDLDRVFEELEWCAKRGIARLFLADANFGILERDVQIADKVAELKRTYGYPTLFSTNYAKNSTKHLQKIVGTLADAGILNQGLLSLQSMDGETLKTVKRSNIKLTKYEELAREFRNADLPLFIDLMMGLPGATTESFRADLQGCIDREVTAKVYPTELLVNSPMNEPAYRRENKIETSAPLGGLVRTSRNADGTTKRALVVSTLSFTRADYEQMLQLRHAFLISENFGVLRQVSRYVRQECGLDEIDFYDQLRIEARDHLDRWPAIAFAFQVIPSLGTPPVSWRFFIDEIRDYVTGTLGIIDDDALDTVLRVQHALLPARDRQFPITLELTHDYAAWHHAMVDAKDAGNADWQALLPPLREHPPGTFLVDDPHEVCRRALGQSIDENLHGSWELASPLARAVSHEHMWDA